MIVFRVGEREEKMRKKRFLRTKKILARFMVLVLAATSLSVNGAFTPQNAITVEAAEQWSSTGVYTQGNQVEYNGAIYQAKWWTQGDQPDQGGPWELVSGGSGSGTGGGTTGGTTGGGSLEGTNATETLDPKVGTNIQGVTLPSNYYNKKVVGYFPNYAINSEAHKKFSIADLQWDVLTHIQYAFGVVNKNTYELEAGDIENDINNKFEDRQFYHDGVEIKMDESLGYYGQFNLMHTLKKMHPNVTVLISTGGWGASEGLWYATQNENTMRTFSASAVKFIRKYGFDGIDIDFEFPSETPLSGNYTDFTESIRPGIATRYAQFIRILSEDLAKASKEDGKYYWLTSAVSASAWVLGGQTDSAFLDYLDFVSIMSYDYHGGWNNYVENQANLYPDPADTETATQAVKTLGFEWSYRFYRGKVQPEKILMGVPYYTRGWKNVSGGTNGLHGSSGTPLTNDTDNLNLWYDEDANGNETPAGANPLWHVMNVMKNNPSYQRYWDDVGKVPHIWNATNNTFLTFEDKDSIQERINYIKSNNLGGVLIWVMHGDYDYDEAKGEYVIGDTLTSMLYDQFKAAGPSTVSSDIDYTNKALDFNVDFGGKYDHPNFTYSIKVTNNSGVTIPSGFNFSFYLPKSCEFTSSWGGSYSTRDVDNSFTEVTLTSSSGLPAGGTVEFTGMMKCCFSGAKNFKINGLSMLSEVNSEIKRLNRSYITDANGGNTPVEPPTTKAPETTKPEQITTTAQPQETTTKSQQVTTNTQPQETTTKASSGRQPIEVIGLHLENAGDNAISVVWGQDQQMIDLGQKYNVYVDGVKKFSEVGCALYTIEGISAGTRTVRVSAVLDGNESAGQTETITVSGADLGTDTTTKAPEAGEHSASVEINGYQISTTVEGFRTVYTVDDPDNEVLREGLVYGLAGYVSPDDMVVNSTNNKVYDYAATNEGKINKTFGTSSTVQSYAMTMKFIKTSEFYNAGICVRAYAQLKDGTYVYSNISTTKVYDIADQLYSGLYMNSLTAHNYLYENILKIVNPSYIEKNYDLSKTVVGIGDM